jgi:hypothetical protein
VRTGFENHSHDLPKTRAFPNLNNLDMLGRTLCVPDPERKQTWYLFVSVRDKGLGRYEQVHKPLAAIVARKKPRVMMDCLLM